jgi:hypothetical protein
MAYWGFGVLGFGVFRRSIAFAFLGARNTFCLGACSKCQLVARRGCASAVYQVSLNEMFTNFGIWWGQGV